MGRDEKPLSSHADDSDDSGRSGFFQTTVSWVRDFAIGAGIVLILLMLIVGVAGVWPPFGAVISGSMEPVINQGDLVVFTDTERFEPSGADEHGIVTHDRGEEHGVESFGEWGLVISFSYSDSGQDIIHRAMFYVEEGEDWVERADPEYLDGESSCDDLTTCPAPHDGYITMGDNNGYYDQVQVGREPIKPEWISGVVEWRIPYVGWLRMA